MCQVNQTYGIVFLYCKKWPDENLCWVLMTDFKSGNTCGVAVAATQPKNITSIPHIVKLYLLRLRFSKVLKHFNT